MPAATPGCRLSTDLTEIVTCNPTGRVKPRAGMVADANADVRPYPGTGITIMAKGQMRGNLEVRKPKMVKAVAEAPAALPAKAVLDRIRVSKKKR